MFSVPLCCVSTLNKHNLFFFFFFLPLLKVHFQGKQKWRIPPKIASKTPLNPRNNKRHQNKTPTLEDGWKNSLACFCWTARGGSETQRPVAAEEQLRQKHIVYHSMCQHIEKPRGRKSGESVYVCVSVCVCVADIYRQASV